MNFCKMESIQSKTPTRYSRDPEDMIRLLQSLKTDEIVIAGKYIGALRYLGPLSGDVTKECSIANLWCGIELTEPS